MACSAALPLDLEPILLYGSLKGLAGFWIMACRVKVAAGLEFRVQGSQIRV